MFSNSDCAQSAQPIPYFLWIDQHAPLKSINPAAHAVRRHPISSLR
jgi:hypothetical protein